MQKTLRISRLTEHDFMRIRALDIQPGRKSLVVLRGPNEAGKTSAIRALIAALSGKRADPEVPIRDGQEAAAVDIVLADDVAARLRVSVSWTPAGRYLTVKEITPDGDVRIPAGQSALDSIVGELGFDPLRFMHAKSTEQVELLMTAIRKKDAYDQLQQRRQKYYDERTEINRSLKSARAALAATPDPQPGCDLTEAGIASIKAELDTVELKRREASDYEAKVATFQRGTDAMQEQSMALAGQIVSLEAQLHQAKDRQLALAREIDERTAKLKIAGTRLAALKSEVPSVDAVAALTVKYSQHNEQVNQQRQHRKAAEEVQKWTRESSTCTAALETIDAECRSLIANSDLEARIPGLEINVLGEVVHNGLPIQQASGMQQLTLSCLIGMSMSPQLRIMCIDEGDKLDPESLKRLTEIAKEHDYQLWMTAVYAGADDDLSQVVTINDGTHSGATTQRAKPPAEKRDRKQNDDDVSAMYGSAPTVAPPKAASTPPPAEPVNIDELEL